MKWVQSSEGMEQPRPMAAEEDAQFAQDHPLRILIADDDYISRRVLCLYLCRLGYDVKTTENGRECLNAVLAKTYDLLLTDIDMPEMNGIECTARIREVGIGLHIVALTATSPEQTHTACLEAGMDGYMRKPIDFGRLMEELRSISTITKVRMAIEANKSKAKKPRTVADPGFQVVPAWVRNETGLA